MKYCDKILHLPSYLATCISGVNGKPVCRISFRLGRNDEIRKEYLSTGVPRNPPPTGGNPPPRRGGTPRNMTPPPHQEITHPGGGEDFVTDLLGNPPPTIL